MSKTSFTIDEQKQNVISFIKKHKDILCLDYDRKAITAKFISELKNANNEEFFSLVRTVRFAFGLSLYYIFADNRDEKHRMLEIWLPAVLRKVESDTAIEIACSRKSFEVVIETNCDWLVMTPTRWKMFEAIFDFYEEVVF